MVSKLRARLTYANVMVTVLAFIVLGGGVAYAATHLPKNSVGIKQLKKNSVNGVKVKDGSLTEADLKSGSLTGAAIQPGSLTGAVFQSNSVTGAQIDQGSLNAVRASNVTGISLVGDGNCTPLFPLPPGVSSEWRSTGVCRLTFPSSPASCTVNATVHIRNATLLGPADRTADVVGFASTRNSFQVETREDGTPADDPVDVTLVC